MIDFVALPAPRRGLPIRLMAFVCQGCDRTWTQTVGHRDGRDCPFCGDYGLVIHD